MNFAIQCVLTPEGTRPACVVVNESRIVGLVDFAAAPTAVELLELWDRESLDCGTARHLRSASGVNFRHAHGHCVVPREGSATIGFGALDPSGLALLSTSALTVGTHFIRVLYLGDGSFEPSSSSVLGQVVNSGAGQLSLAKISAARKIAWLAPANL